MTVTSAVANDHHFSICYCLWPLQLFTHHSNTTLLFLLYLHLSYLCLPHCPPFSGCAYLSLWFFSATHNSNAVCLCCCLLLLFLYLLLSFDRLLDCFAANCCVIVDWLLEWIQCCALTLAFTDCCVVLYVCSVGELVGCGLQLVAGRAQIVLSEVMWYSSQSLFISCACSCILIFCLNYLFFVFICLADPLYFSMLHANAAWQLSIL